MKTQAKTILWGTVIGTVVMFFWGATEWFNPLLQSPYKQVADQEEVNQTLIRNLDENGIYVWHKDTHLHLGGSQQLAESEQDIMYFIAKKDGSYYQPGRHMGVQLINQIILWWCIVSLLVRLRIANPLDMIKLVAMLALIVGLGYFMPMWNWWGFSTEYVLVRWGNLLVGWLLAATAVSIYLKKRIQTTTKTL